MEVGVRERLLTDGVSPAVTGRLSLANACICLICLARSSGRGVREVNVGGRGFDKGNSTLSVQL